MYKRSGSGRRRVFTTGTFAGREWSFIGESARATPENSRNKGRIRQVGLVRGVSGGIESAQIPRFAFEKFPQADPALTTPIKSVGEAMAIGRTFKERLQNACARWRSAAVDWAATANPGASALNSMVPQHEPAIPRRRGARGRIARRAESLTSRRFFLGLLTGEARSRGPQENCDHGGGQKEDFNWQRKLLGRRGG